MSRPYQNNFTALLCIPFRRASAPEVKYGHLFQSFSTAFVPSLWDFASVSEVKLAVLTGVPNGLMGFNS